MANLAGVLTHPLTIGTGLGALGGAGIGYMTSGQEEPRDIRLRKALVGGATGAAIGALGGGLAGRGSLRAARQAEKAVDDAVNVGEARGFEDALRKMRSDFNMAKKVMEGMPQEMRDRLVKTFQRGWLTRWFGG